MKDTLPDDPRDFLQWSWADIEPFYRCLVNYSLAENNLRDWLDEWSHLAGLVYETFQRHFVALTRDTNNPKIKESHDKFLDEIYPFAEAAEQRLKEKLLSSGMQPAGFEMPLRNLRAEAEIFCGENLPILAEELKLGNVYDQIIGAQTVIWQGKEITLVQLQAVLLDPDRPTREKSWRMWSRRWLDDRQAINRLWVKLLENRTQQAKNARLSDYRAYCWKKLYRFDYTPEDCRRFHEAIEDVVVPAVNELYEKRRKKLGISSLRPWDLNVNSDFRPPLQPFDRVEELEDGTARIFKQVDLQLGEFFDVMRREGLLDLENRKNKTSGGYCTDFPVSGRPFILMNAVGIHDDVQTLLHEGGHGFHVFLMDGLPYYYQKKVGNEFCEVASMGMELLAAPYLEKEHGGFYTPEEAARARLEFLEESICFWPYMAVVDSFQHWVYENPVEAADPALCDAKWGELYTRFVPGVDWSGFEEALVSGWQRKGHIFQNPFYYVEYGIAMLGAFQVWKNALENQLAAVTAYKKALALGGTVPLPQLFEAAGIRFAFDADALHQAVDLGMETIEKLQKIPSTDR